MSHYNKRRKRSIETPLGPVEIVEKKWNEGEDDEHWAYVQCLNPEFPDCEETCDISNAVVIGFFVKQYSIVKTLVAEGYEFYHQLDGENFLWVNYTDQNS